MFIDIAHDDEIRKPSIGTQLKQKIVCSFGKINYVECWNKVRTLTTGWKIFFLLRFYAIMHRTTIVQDKIITIICSFIFFVRLIFIGRV